MANPRSEPISPDYVYGFSQSFSISTSSASFVHIRSSPNFAATSGRHSFNSLSPVNGRLRICGKMTTLPGYFPSITDSIASAAVSSPPIAATERPGESVPATRREMTKLYYLVMHYPWDFRNHACSYRLRYNNKNSASMSWLLYLRKSALHLAKNSIPGFLAWFAGQKPITQTAQN